MIHATLILVALAGLPIPDAQAQSSAEALIQEVYGEQLEAARDPEQKANLAREILEVAKQETVPANKYVGLQTVKRLAVEAEDGALGLEAVKVLAATFASETGADAETLIRQAEALWEAAERKRGTDQLAGRLEAVELWLRSGSTSPLMAKKWEERINGLAPAAEIVLHAKDAKLVGPLKYVGRVDSVGNWTDPQAYIEWRASLEGGSYLVSIEYAHGYDQPSGIVAISVVSPDGKRPIYSIPFSVQPTGKGFVFINKVVGQVRLRSPGTYALRLHVVRKAPSAIHIMQVRSLRLSSCGSL